jgi:prepilin-type N-terminal cleavage/methylation domain-containing protein
MLKHKNYSGFTIVELLIVIVVIAVLAAITIVAFNGIQNRANAAKDVSAANGYVKALKMLVAEKGEAALPTTDSCLGDTTWYPAASPQFQLNQCNVWSYDSGATYGGYTPGIFPIALLTPYMSNKPQPSANVGYDNGASSGAIQYSRGLAYQKLNPLTWNGRFGRVYWMRNGKIDCPNAGYDSAANLTWCYLYF